MPDATKVKAELGSIRDVLERHGINPRRPTCPNPQHDDRKPGSVGIYKSKSGEERLKCFACSFNGDVINVAQVLGERINWGKIPRRVERPKARRERVAKVRVSRELEDDLTIEKDWILAKKLAELGSLKAVHIEVQRDWDYLSENYNLPRAYELCQKIWDYGAEKFGLPHDQDFRHWVDRVAVALER